MKHAMTHYRVVVESGSCSPDYRRWEEQAHCGHKHRTIGAAEKCLAKLTRYVCQHGRPAHSLCGQCLGGFARADNTSAYWWGARIHNQEGERVDYAEANHETRNS
jgi:hypothetical protein